MRQSLAGSCVVALMVAACGDHGAPAPRRLGQRADSVALTSGLTHVARLDPDARLQALASLVLDHCGDECQCLRGALEPGGASSCPAANPSVPVAWPALEVCGRYLGQELRTQPAGRGDPLRAALTALTVRFPRLDGARWAPALARHTRPLSSVGAVVGVTADGIVEVAAMPWARFDDAGVHLVEATPPERSDAGAIDAAIERARRGVPAPPPAAPLGALPPLDNDGWPPGYGVLAGGDLVGRTQYVGEVGGALSPTQPVVAIASSRHAISVAQAFGDRGGAIGVGPNGAGPFAELPIAFTSGAGRPAPRGLVLRRHRDLVTLSTDVVRYQWDLSRGFDVAAIEAALRTEVGVDGAITVEVEEVTAGDVVAMLDLALATAAKEVWLIINPDEHPPLTGRPLGSAPLQLARFGTIVASGGLHDAIIRRYLRRNLSRVTYCYERELLVAPNLAGVVRTTFAIDAQGAVISASASGVDTRVSTCISDVLKAIEFPRPNSAPVMVRVDITLRPS